MAPWMSEMAPWDMSELLSRTLIASHLLYILLISDLMENSRHPSFPLCYRHSHPTTAFDREALLNTVPEHSRNAVQHVWALYANSSAAVREAIALGIVDASCMRQLTALNRAVRPRLRMDILQMLPPELSLRVLGFLDARSLCRTSLVCKLWHSLANADAVWFRLCQQHIDRKCFKCGWGLPLLPRKRKREHDPPLDARHTPATSRPPALDLDDVLHRRSGYRGGLLKRSHTSLLLNVQHTPTDRLPWKSLYAERQVVGRNWRTNNFSTSVLVPPTASLQPRVTSTSLDEPYLMTAAMDGVVRVWDMDANECLVSLQGHRGAVMAVHFDDRHCLAASGGIDGNVRLWNWTSGQCVRTLGGHSVPVTAIHFDRGILVSADAASIIRVWDFVARSCFTLCHGNLCPVTRVMLCRGSLFSAGEDGIVRMWDLNTRACIKTFAPLGTDPVPGQAPAVTSMHVVQAHVPDGLVVYVLSGMANGHAYLYKAAVIPSSKPVPISSPAPPHKSVHRPVVAPVMSFHHEHPITSVWMDALKVITCGTNGRALVWDIDTGVVLNSYAVGGSAGVVAASDTKLVAAREDGVIHVWNFAGSANKGSALNLPNDRAS